MRFTAVSCPAMSRSKWRSTTSSREMRSPSAPRRAAPRGGRPPGLVRRTARRSSRYAARPLSASAMAAYTSAEWSTIGSSDRPGPGLAGEGCADHRAGPGFERDGVVARLEKGGERFVAEAEGLRAQCALACLTRTRGYRPRLRSCLGPSRARRDRWPDSGPPVFAPPRPGHPPRRQGPRGSPGC